MFYAALPLWLLKLRDDMQHPKKHGMHESATL